MNGKEILEVIVLVAAAVLWLHARAAGRSLRKERREIEASIDSLRRAKVNPWSLPPDVVREGFDQVRAGVPVDEDELSGAKPVKHVPKWRPEQP